MRRRLQDAAALIAVAAALLWVGQTPTAWLRDGNIYVATSGSDWFVGATPERAVRTLQRAADLVSPGEHIVILPGVYEGNLRIRRGGREAQPVVFRAEQPGTVTITGQAPAAVTLSLSWVDEGSGIHSTTPPWPIYYMRQGEEALYGVAGGGLKRLRTLTERPRAYAAFSYDADHSATRDIASVLPLAGWSADAQIAPTQDIP